MDGWMDGDRWIDELMDGWLVEWMDGLEALLPRSTKLRHRQVLIQDHETRSILTSCFNTTPFIKSVIRFM